MNSPPSTPKEEAEMDVESLVGQISRQVKHMREYLPKVLSPDLLTGYSKILDLEDECSMLRVSLKDSKQRENSLSKKCDSLMASNEQDKQEFFQLKHEVSSLNELIAEQASFCSTVGATTCNLLWKMSHCAGAVDSILTGNMLVDFLQLASSSLDGFIETCHGLVSEDSPEVTFVLAICGVLTNVFATPSGRDYLMESGYGSPLIDQYISILGKDVRSERLKNIVLMAIYNISISQAGLELVASRPSLVPMLTQILISTSTSGLHLQALKLLQSIAAEGHTSCAARDTSNQRLYSYLGRAVPASHVLELVACLHLLPVSAAQISLKLIQKFSKDSNFEIRAVSRDIMTDLAACQHEP